MDKKQLIKRSIVIGVALLVIVIIFLCGERQLFRKESGSRSEGQILEDGSRLFKGPTGTPYVKGPTTPPPGTEITE